MTKIIKDREWEDMPEFIQEKKEPYFKIIIRCETKEDMLKLQDLLEQTFTEKTKSAWFPYKSHFTGNSKNRWVDDV